MLDYIDAIYDGKSIYDPAPCSLANEDAVLACLVEQVRQEMGQSFADRLEKYLYAEFDTGRKWAFRDGFQLGGRMMLAVLETAGY